MASQEQFFYPSCTGSNSIHASLMLPEGQVRGIVQIVHGIAEHIGRYSAFMEFLTQKGFAAVGEDHLGHGQSYTNEQEKGFFAKENGWDCVVEDVYSLNRQMHARFPGVPYIVFGHSMGSFLTRTLILRHPDAYDLVILSGTGNQSPAMVSGGLLMAELLCKIEGAEAVGTKLDSIAFGSYLNKIPNARTKFDWLTTDAAIVDAYIADEACGFVAKNGLYRDMMHGLKFITSAKNIASIDKSKPIYLMSGKDDPVGDYGKGVERAYQAYCKAGCKDVTIRLYPGGRHEMLNEANKDAVCNDILSWINSRLG